MMKAVAEADEKKRKRMVPGSAGGGSSSSAPPMYRMVYTCNTRFYNNKNFVKLVVHYVAF
jgi:hypothetical protein